MIQELNITLIEVFDTGSNQWSWQKIVRKDDVDEAQERKYALAESMGNEYQYLNLEDREYIDTNYEEDTRVCDLTV